MWELHESSTNNEHMKSFVIGQPGIIKFGGWECDIVIQPSVRGEIARLLVTNVHGFQFNLSESVQGQSLVNGVSLSKEYQCIKSGDVIHFPSAPTKNFVLFYVETNILFSSMDRDMKRKMKAVATSIGANTLNEWSNKCNLLIMQSLVVTSKVIYALLKCIPIVTPDYLEEIKKIRCNKIAVKPDPKDFMPIVKEEKLTQNDASRFSPNDLRRHLFSGKVFLVLSKYKYDTLSEMVHLGSGRLYLFDSPDALQNLCSDSKMCLSKCVSLDKTLHDVLLKPECCVVHLHPTSGIESWQRKIYTVLRSLRRRPILESELGFAVVYCSTKLYCNPDKRCPDGLYQEIDVSGAFSVNPFQIESQVMLSEFSESSVTVNNARIPDLSYENILPKMKNIESDTGHKLNLCQTVSSCENKFGSSISRIFPTKTPERIVPGRLLVCDSERVFSQKFVDSPLIPPLDSENQEPYKLKTTSEEYISTSTYEPSLLHRRSVCADDELLNTLNCMPSLLQTTIKKGILLEPNTNNKNDSTQLSTFLPTENVNNVKPEILKHELSILKNHSDSPVVSELNLFSPELNKSPPFSSKSVNCASEGWLRKRITGNDVSDIDTSNQTNLVIITPMTVSVNIPNSTVIDKHCDKINFKNFIKVWPAYFSQNLSLKSGVSRSYPLKPIHLASFQQTLERNSDDLKRFVKSEYPKDDEQERINKLFDEACKAPSLRKFGKFSAF
ncbi:Nibrin [Schistosoma japonicum]|nr:Nibrin [Schistosoma japonicum]